MSNTEIAVEILIELLERHFELVVGLFLLTVAVFAVGKKKKQQKNAKKLLQKAVAKNAIEPASLHPEIDPAMCAGCGACTRVCPEGDILKMVNHKAVLVGANKCVGHGECERACPMNAITLVFGTKTRGVDIPRVTAQYETNVPGLYIAGELGGMGLIRNAVRQGVLAATHAVQHLPPQKTAQYDLVIIGAGPAGLTSALVAIANRKSYLLIEQNTTGGTVYNFPRQKIVMSYPAELPMVGKMQFPKNKISKEELLGFWSDVRRKTGMKVNEKTTFNGLEMRDGNFVVKTTRGEFTAAKVILCMGVRGSPRRLGLLNEDLPKVTYNLLDPEQYQGRDIVVVGGGNAGVEAAQMLGAAKYKNRVKLLVRGQGFDRCNEENEKKIRAMAHNGLVEIWFGSSVKEIQPDTLTVAKGEENVKIKNDYLFVFAGAEMPHKFLMSLGVKIDKKFGEALKKSG